MSILDQGSPFVGTLFGRISQFAKFKESTILSSVISLISSNGWQATYPVNIPSDFTTGSPVTFFVGRRGYDANTNRVTVTETVTVTKRIRQPYPSQATLTTDQVALSDFVHQGDVVAGVINNSTTPYPTPICMWLTPDMEKATSNTYTVRLAVAHAYARQGRAVAAVKFIVSDGTNSTQQIVSTTSSSVFASGLYGPYFEAALDISTLTNGVVCTVDAIIYPWVGDVFQASVNGATYPSINFTVLKFLNDRTGAFGAAYAYVDAVAGNDTTGAVSAVATTAATTPYLTIAAAANALKTFNNTNYGRNEAGGGTIRLQPGTYTHSSISAAGASLCPLTIEAADPTKAATTIYSDGGVTTYSGFPPLTTFNNITLQKGGASNSFLDTSGLLANRMAFNNVIFDRNNQAQFKAWLYRPGRCYMINCTGDPAGTFGAYGNVVKEVNLIGCNFQGQQTNTVYNIFTSRVAIGYDMLNTTASESAVGQLYHHSFFSQTVSSAKAFQAVSTIGTGGLGVIGCVLEATAGNTSPAMSFSADSVTLSAQNALCIGNTIVGASTNWMYNDVAGSPATKYGWFRFNVNTFFNIKSDVFCSSSNNVLNWSEIYNVGNGYNAAIYGDSANDLIYHPGSWLGEVGAVGDVLGTLTTPLVVNWANDQSYTGGRLGQGDYTPGVGNNLPLIPGNLIPFAVDQKGQVLSTTGAAVSGAIQ